MDVINADDGVASRAEYEAQWSARPPGRRGAFGESLGRTEDRWGWCKFGPLEEGKQDQNDWARGSPIAMSDLWKLKTCGNGHGTWQGPHLHEENGCSCS